MVFLQSATPVTTLPLYTWNVVDTFTNSLGQKFTQVVGQYTYKQLIDNNVSPPTAYSYLVGTTAGGYSVSVAQNHSVTLRSTITGATQTFNVSATVDGQIPGLIPTGSTIIILSDITTASSATNTLNDIVNWVQSQSLTTTNYQVTIKAINGTQKTFIISGSDNTTLNTPGFLAGGVTLISDFTSTIAVNATLNDIGTWLTQNATGGTTPPPTTIPPPPAPTNFKVGGIATDSIGMTWDASTNPNIRYLIYRNNTQQVANNWFPPAFTDTGLTASTSYTYTIKAVDVSLTSNNVSTGVSFTASTIAAPVATPNFTYFIQYVSSSNTPPLTLFTTTNYGGTIGGSIQFPARQFVQNTINITNPNIPTTLTAIVQPKVSNPVNDASIANYLNTYFAGPPVPGQSGTIFDKAKGIFAGLITLYLISGGSSNKDKKKHA